jgi:hypothetical protein
MVIHKCISAYKGCTNFDPASTNWDKACMSDCGMAEKCGQLNIAKVKK